MKNLWLGKNIKDAIDDTRLHNQLFPEYTEIEKGFSQVIIYFNNATKILKNFEFKGDKKDFIEKKAHN